MSGGRLGGHRARLEPGLLELGAHVQGALPDGVIDGARGILEPAAQIEDAKSDRFHVKGVDGTGQVRRLSDGLGHRSVLRQPLQSAHEVGQPFLRALDVSGLI